MSKARFTVALVLTAGLALSACSGEATPTTSASVSSAPINREALLWYTTAFSVENELKDWWGGNGIPITWKVSETDNYDWGGIRRPDHAPPDGFQGLVQEPFSGVYNVNLQVNGRGRMSANGDSRFVLTPVATIDGQAVDLQPIVVIAGESLVAAGSSCSRPENGTATATTSLSAKTPRELLMYDVVLTCYADSSFKQRILIRNYQRS